MSAVGFEMAHLLAGGVVLISFLLLYQDRLPALIKVFALHAATLAAAVAWQAHLRGAPDLYVTALVYLVLKGAAIPLALDRLVKRLGVHREVETFVAIGPTMLAGMGLVALAMVVMLKAAPRADPLAREDLAFALSIVLLGLLMMITRRNAVSQVIGFFALEDGLVLAATGAEGMPLIIEISVAFSVVVAFVVIGVFLLRIREQFDTVAIEAIDRVRGGGA